MRRKAKDTLPTPPRSKSEPERLTLDPLPALVVGWSMTEPGRLGEVLLLGCAPDHRVWVLGRYDSTYDFGAGSS
jgi:hypothetical protein